MSNCTPPDWLERVVETLIGPGPSTPYIIGDLREDFRSMFERRSRLRACVWYLAEGVRVAVRVRLERRRHASPPPERTEARSRGRGAADIVATDLRQALRFLLRRPVLSGSVVLTVALAVSAATAVFAVVDGVLLDPLPYATPERLVAVWESNPRGEGRNVVSPANFLTWREEMESFDAVASVLETSTTVIGEGPPEPVGWIQASAAYFEMVGAEAVAGRLYGEADDRPGAGMVAVLSEGFWRRRFGADPGVVGRTIRLGLTPGGVPVEVVGVVAERYDFEVTVAAFGGIGSRDVWLPPRFPEAAGVATGRYLQVLARLAPGATSESAQEEASALAARLADTFPDRQRGWGINVVGLHEDLVGDVRPALLVVFGAVCFVLLIACANVANLLMTRASEREQEMAVRSAMGAGRGRLVRQLFTESALLCVAGGVLAALLAHAATRSLVRAAPDIPRLEEVGVDPTVVAFSLLATCGAALLFGLAPALSLGRPNTEGWLRARSLAGLRRGRRARGTLVVAQVALSLVLLVGAGLLVRSLVNRLDVGVGFEVEGLLTAGVQLGGSGYEPQERALLFEELVSSVGELPGVRGASAIGGLPLAGLGTRTTFWPLDRPVPEPGQLPGADVRPVHREYHDVMGIPLLAGRTFDESDRGDAPLVVLVNETGAERIWPGENPVGKRIAMPWTDTLVAEVVGVVGDVRDRGPDTEPYPMLYWEHRQFSSSNSVSVVARTEETARARVATGIQDELAELDPGLALYNVRTMESLFADAMRQARLATIALGLFALVALLLAAIGIYGVVAHATARRTQEIGIRMALGAGRPTILGMVVREGMAQVLLAIALGTLGALVFARLLQGLVFGVSTADPLTFAVTVGLLAAVGLLATWLPARRASGIDPAETIRVE